jgi:glycosyltransferase involved in cell wall biosynthesis
MQETITTPLISIVIPTFNRAELLREALESVYNQSYKNFQVIVVDDGSTDHTAQMLEEYEGRVNVVWQSRGGISAARNAGLDQCRGEFVAFLDNDDLWAPDKLEAQVAFALATPQATVTYTDAFQFNAEGQFPKTFVDHFPALKDPTDLFQRMIEEYAIPLMSTVMIRLNFLRENSLRFQEFAGIDDLFLFLEILRRGGRFAYLPRPLTWRRMHAGNFSGNHRRRFEERARLYRTMLAEMADLTTDQRRALKLGLRDAQYRVAECNWEDLQFPEARKQFLQCVGPDKRGLRALAYSFLSFLPRASIMGLRQWKAGARGRAL